jgi:hypothetical protein
MTTTIENGRLGNQIIRNLAVSLIAEKYNLYVEYCNKSLINDLGINLFIGKEKFNNMITIDDNNYFSIYNCSKLESNLDPNSNFFQTKDITNFLYNYLHKDEIKSNIINKNEFNNRYNANNDLFIHIRLTDIAHYNPGVNYYIKTIKTINFDNLYISSDEPTHAIIQEIIKQDPTSIIIKYDEIKTIHFASTCKHIILSHGSFSAVIGYLSFYSTIHYPEYELNKLWYGDMFSIDGWVKHSITSS